MMQTVLNFRQAGFSMLEVLIALVVFSIGLLGMAALQTASMRSMSGSGQLVDAVYFAEDIADRIRANRQHAVTGTTYNSIANAANNNCSNGCTAAQIAAKDLFDWQTAVGAGLSGGGVNIARVGNAYNITVSWNETASDGQIDAQLYEIRVEP